MRWNVTLVAVLISLASVTGCSSSETETSGPDEKWSAVVDVRTADEYDAGHVADAVLMDVQSSDFAAEVAALPDEGTYLVYCHSGNRAAAAVEQMKAAGLSAVSGGGLQDMVDAGWTLAD